MALAGIGLLARSVRRKYAGYDELESVSAVDIKRYLGDWHEIARYPHRFEKGCEEVAAHYSSLADGRIKVVNECYKGGAARRKASIEGTARIVDDKSNAKLKVSFFWPFEGDYWILDVGPDYEYAVVGEPRRKHLWILSRSPEMDEDVYRRLLKTIESKGYDPRRLIVSGRIKRRGDLSRRADAKSQGTSHALPN